MIERGRTMKKVISLLLVLMLCLGLYACNNSSNENDANSQAATKHSHEWKIISCSEPKTCATCGETEGDAVGHDWQEANCMNPKTCKACGIIEGEITDHQWKEATCSEPKTCPICGETEGDAIGHDWQEADCTNPEICKTCGTVGAAAGHRWKNATCQAPKTCTVCDATEGSTGDHSYKDATCTNPQVCTVCEATVGSALGCTAGSDGNCIRCGKSLVKIADMLSAPMDSISQIKRLSSYYAGDCYSGGNFRLIFNSADGVILSWGATNTSSKEIKYLTFTIKYYNQVGDPAYDSISGNSSYTARLTGPIGAGKSFFFRRLIGYGSDIYYGKITNVKIEYMDGTSVSGNYGYTTWHNIRTSASPKECFIIED